MQGNTAQHDLPSWIARLSGGRAGRLPAAVIPQRFTRGQTIFRQGQPADAIWIVQEGWIHLLRAADATDSARAVVIFTITPAEVFCGLSAVTPGSVYHVSAVVGTSCRTLRVPAPLFRDALAHEPAFAPHVVRLCVQRIQHIAQQYGAMAEPVPHRVARAILRLADQFGPSIPMTHRELAQMAWTTTESAIRVVRRFKAAGYLSGERGRLALGRRASLERFLDGAGRRGRSVEDVTVAERMPQGRAGR